MADKQWTFSRMQRIIGGKPVINCGDYMGFQKETIGYLRYYHVFSEECIDYLEKSKYFSRKCCVKKTEVIRVR